MENFKGTQLLLNFLLFLDVFVICDAQFRRPTKCELEPSINKGPNYFRRLTPWGKWLDMPCAPGTYFIQTECGCGFIPEENLVQMTTKRTTILSTSKKVKVTTPIGTTTRSTEKTTKITRPTTPRTTSTPKTTKTTTPVTTSTSTKRTTPLTTTTTAKQTTPLTTTTTTKQMTPLTTATTTKQTTPLSTTTSTKQTTPLPTTTTTKRPTTSLPSTTTTKRPTTSLPTTTTTKRPTTSLPTTTTTKRPTTSLPTTTTTKRPTTPQGTTSVSANKTAQSTTTPSKSVNDTTITSKMASTPTTVAPSTSTRKHNTSAGVGTQDTSEVTIRNASPNSTTKGTTPLVITSTGSLKSVTTSVTSLSSNGTAFTTQAVKNVTVGNKVTSNVDSTAQTLKPVTLTTSVTGTPSIHNNSIDNTTRIKPIVPESSSMPTIPHQINSTTEIQTSTTTGSTTTETPVSTTTAKVTTESPTSTTRATTTTTTSKPCKFRKIENDKYSYLEFINAEIGWIQFQCQHGKEFNFTYCGCFYPGEGPQTTTLKTTSAVTTGSQSDCPYKKEGRVSFKEYIEQLQSWVYSECADGYVFSQIRCGCVLEGFVPEDEIDNVAVTKLPINKVTTDTTGSTILTTIKVPDDCPYVAVGDASFREYVDTVQSWVYSDCPDGQIFSQKQCICISKDCPYKADGGTSFRKYIEDIGEWVHAECTDGHVFSHRVCNCVPGGDNTDDTNTGRGTTPGPTGSTLPPVTNPNCPFVPVELGYREYIAEIDHWVTYMCPIDKIFDVLRCACVNQQILTTTIVPDSTSLTTPKQNDETGKDKDDDTKAITSAPTKQPTVFVTSPDCPFAPDNDGYREFIPDIQQWVTYDCPSNHEFSVARCMCVDKYKNQSMTTTPSITTDDYTKDNTITDIPQTTVPTSPTSFIRNPDCAFEAKGDGYREFVVEVGQWVTYECAQGQTFDVMLCSCAGKDSTKSMNVTEPNTDKKVCNSRPSDMGNDHYYMNVTGWGEVMYNCDSGQIYSQKACGCVNNEIISKTTTPVTGGELRTTQKITFINPENVKKREKFRPGNH